MDSIKTIEELRNVPTTYKQVFQNTFTNSVDKTKTISAKYNDAITDRDIKIAELLFNFRFATLDQIYRYLELKNELEDETSKASLKVRLDKLVKMYRVLNKFVLSPYEHSGFDSDELEFYCLDLGGQFLLYNFTDQSETNICNWRPKNANLHTPTTVYRDIRILEFYLKLMDVFQDELIYFKPYKRMTFDKKQTTVTFDFCVDKGHYEDYQYFIGEMVTEDEMISRFYESADALEQIVSTNTWKKYYTMDKPPVILFFVDDDDIAMELAEKISLRQIDRYRITTIDRIKGDLSTAFMVYDKDSDKLRLGKSQLFEKQN